jgi:hypothetical protein
MASSFVSYAVRYKKKQTIIDWYEVNRKFIAETPTISRGEAKGYRWCRWEQ